MKYLRLITNAVLAGMVVVLVALPASAGHLTMHRQPSRAEVLLDQHGCWQGHAPADVTFPGHVVLDLPNGRTVYGGRRLAGKALDQIFGHKPHGYKVWGFCR